MFSLPLVQPMDGHSVLYESDSDVSDESRAEKKIQKIDQRLKKHK